MGVAILDAGLIDVEVGKSNARIREEQEAEARRQQEEAERQKQAELERIRIAREAAARKQAERQARLAAVPAQAPASQPASGSGGDMETIIRNAAAKYGVNAELMLRIARAESGLNPNARNRSSGASGLFQFLPSTYATKPQAREGRSIFDPVANAEAAAYLLSLPNGQRAWAASCHAWCR